MSHQIVPLGKLGKRKAADRRVLLGKGAKKAAEAPADSAKPANPKDQDKDPELEKPVEGAEKEGQEDEEKPDTPLPKIDPFLLKYDKMDRLEDFLEEPIPFDEDEEEEEEDEL